MQRHPRTSGAVSVMSKVGSVPGVDEGDAQALTNSKDATGEVGDVSSDSEGPAPVCGFHTLPALLKGFTVAPWRKPLDSIDDFGHRVVVMCRSDTR